MTLIRFDAVTVQYAGAPAPVLRGVDLEIPEGELVLVVGETGTGKSTLLRCINGLVPHFTGGVMAGRVVVDGRDTRTHPPRELADLVGLVGQDPVAGFVAEIVEDELAYGMECLGIEPDTMRRRVEETLDLLGLAELRHRPLTSLSGGQRQRVAIGAALTTHPRVLVLDEPTSALDPGAAEEVLAALQLLVHDLGMTVVLAEHRLERVVQYADKVLVVAGGQVTVGDPADMLLDSPVAPPVVELGRLAGWQPLPLSVREARRAAGPLRARLQAVPDSARAGSRRASAPVGVPSGATADVGTRPTDRWRTRLSKAAPTGTPAVAVHGLTAGYPRVPVLRSVDLTVAPGEIVAVMGRNGAGKSTLLATLGGSRVAQSGTVRIGGQDPAALRGRALIGTVGLVPQEPSDLLYATTVERECADADAMAEAPPGRARTLLDSLAPGVDPQAHPRDLSEGQRLALALAVVLASAPPVVLLDEPTRGLDYGAKRRLIEFLARHQASGATVLMATHDVELVAEVATRVVMIAEGEVVADGPTTAVVLSSPLFAPQVAKILTPEPWLTVGEVSRALATLG
jgi:energy-coupling factor transporter ATP-binding protein EcfA2